MSTSPTRPISTLLHFLKKPECLRRMKDVVFAKNGSPATIAVLTIASRRRAKDGEQNLRRGGGAVDPAVEPIAASGQRLAARSAVVGHALCARPADRGLLVADRRTRRRLPRLLLLPGQ